MSEFKLHLYSDDPSIIVESRARTVNDVGRFAFCYLEKKVSEPLDQRILNFLKDIGTGSFWHALYAIDGCNNPLKPDTIKEREEKRQWARENFREHELERILNISVNTALLSPFGFSGCPGDYRGHSILYRELVLKEDSMFYGVVDRDFRKRLNNGRFWEELPDMSPSLNFGISYTRVEDVLMNCYEDLDCVFVVLRGFNIFNRNRAENADFYLRGLSNEAIDKYIEFIRKIEIKCRETGIVNVLIFKALIKPYVGVIQDYEDDGILRFEDSEERLKDPLVVVYGELSVVEGSFL